MAYEQRLWRVRPCLDNDECGVGVLDGALDTWERNGNGHVVMGHRNEKDGAVYVLCCVWLY